jgi:hypothetical protein
VEVNVGRRRAAQQLRTRIGRMGFGNKEQKVNIHLQHDTNTDTDTDIDIDIETDIDRQ